MLKYKSSFVVVCSIFICLGFQFGYSQQLAFPGADGFGKYTTGGRGGIIYYVTNLNDDSNPGSLRYGITRLSGPRTILFKVSGTIALKSDLRIRNGNITIAGQSAPGDGICLKDYTLRVEASNCIIRFIRCRLGDVTKYIDDAMNGNGTVPVSRTNIIIDHCSLSWSIDELGSFYNNKNFTMQWCLLAESLYKSVDPKGDHGYAGIWGGQNASFHHNLLAHNSSRNPRFCGSRYTGDSINEFVDFRNNVLYNWGNINTAYGGEGGNYNMVNNYYKPGPATPNNRLQYRILNYTSYYYATDAKIYPDTVWGGKFYVNGNFVVGNLNTTTDNWNGLGSRPGVQLDSYSGAQALITRNKLNTEIPHGNLFTQTAVDAYNSVVDSVGCVLPNRDSVDLRVLNETKTGTATFGGSYMNNKAKSGIIDSQTTVGGWPTLKSNPAPTDTDNDGMPDEWETDRGLNPNNATDRNNFNKNGYTHVEIFLNGDSIVAMGKANTLVTSKAVTALNKLSWLNLKDTSYTRLISTDTNNFIISVRDSGISNSLWKANYYIASTNRSWNNVMPYAKRSISLNANIALANPIKLRLYLTSKEFNDLKLADTAIKSIRDIQILRSSDTSLANNLTGNFKTLYPTLADTFGTFSNGYLFEVITDSLGSFYFGKSRANLPVTQINLSGKREYNHNVLIGSVFTTSLLKSTQIERSENGRQFTVITSCKTNTNDFQVYRYTDSNVNYSSYYRLVSEDINGKIAYSPILFISASKNSFGIYPNPAKNFLFIQQQLTTPFKQEFYVYAVDGKLWKKVSCSENINKIDISSLAPGKYIITNFSSTASFIKE